MICKYLLQRDTCIIISPEGITCHDLSLDCDKASYLDTMNQMCDLEPGINPHMSMFLEPFKGVVLILF